MALQCSFQSYTLDFRFVAGTSRGTMTQRHCWFIRVWQADNPDVYGLGEVAPLPGLSMDGGLNYTEIIPQVFKDLKDKELPASESGCLALAASLSNDDQPALRFGLETALLDLWSGGKRLLFSSAFTAGQEDIPINGLIWMGDREFMRRQARQKIESGFTCIKMKIGAIDFEAELEILSMLRSEGIQVLRVDANGAFSPQEAPSILERLAAFDLHSIEQPIQPRQWEAMRTLCAESPVPVALDEELIGVRGERIGELLDELRPPYIILKPSLLGGIAATRDWVREAENRGIGWWMTSALESNIGLNAIAQLTAVFNYQGHQGLGTGQLYENNFKSPMCIRRGTMHYDKSHSWNLAPLTNDH